jgi:hypothetical protein
MFGSVSLTNIWIVMKLGRPVSWDVAAERFVNDPPADEMLARHERAPYGVQRFLRAADWQPTAARDDIAGG